MKDYRITFRVFVAFTFAVLLTASMMTPFAPTHARTMATPALQAPNVDAAGFYATDKAQRGRTIQAAFVIDIPRGFHVNSNRPLGKYAVPTVVRLEAPEGVKVSPITYPRSTVRRFKFSEEQLAVYEGLTVMRFNVTVPANFSQGTMQLRARIKYQSCNDEVCFPPANRDVVMPIEIVNANEQVQRVNTKLFGSGARRR